MKKYRSILIMAIMSMVAFVGAPAQVMVTLRMDTNQILIGEQILLKLKVSANANDLIIMPEYPDSQLVNGVEVLSHYTEKVKTLDAGRRQSITEAYRITSFDSSLYYIPPMEVQVGEKMYKSKNGLALKVVSPDVDTTKIDRYFGPKDKSEIYYDWHDFQKPFWLWGTGVLLLLLSLYMAVQIKNNHRILPKIKLHLEGPPHKWAMKQITRLKSNQPTEPDKAHSYYAHLTDILRTYISRRYGFKATAMTSAQIIEQLKGNNDAKLLAELREMFQAADLIKYAGVNAMLDDNDRNLMIAIDYINSTKDIASETKTLKPKEDVVVRRSRRRRVMLIVANVLLAMIGAALFAWAVVIMYNLYF